MITRAEIVTAFRGSVRLLVADPAGMRAFDCTIAGFWRSFQVMVLLAPAVVLSVLIDLEIADIRGATATEPGMAPRLLAGFVSYGLGWIVFPLVLVPLAGPLGLGERYVPFMVARNWSTILGTIPYLIVTLFCLIGVFPMTALGPGSLVALGFNVYYSYRVTRIAAEVPPGVAIGLVVLDFLLTLLIETGVDRLGGF